MSEPTVTFTVHPDGRHRTHMRNTMTGWVEAREPEGIVAVTLEDGFRMVVMGDEYELGDREFLFERARAAREVYLQRAVAP